MKIELLWFEDCPNHVATETLVRDVLRARGLDEAVERIEVPDLDAGEATRFPGSPTIRVDGRDVDPSYEDSGDYAPRCRIYATGDGLRGVPERAWIEAAIDRAIATA